MGAREVLVAARCLIIRLVLLDILFVTLLQQVADLDGLLHHSAKIRWR